MCYMGIVKGSAEKFMTDFAAEVANVAGICYLCILKKILLIFSELFS